MSELVLVDDDEVIITDEEYKYLLKRDRILKAIEEAGEDE